MAGWWKPLLLRGTVAGLGLFVGGHALGLVSLLVMVLADFGGAPEAWAWWRSLLMEPRAVYTLLLSDDRVQRYALGFGALVGCLLLWSALELKGKASRPQMASRYGSHGTGRWAEPGEILAAFPAEGPGAVLGRLKERGRWRPVIFPWSSRTRNRFLLIIGPPGSGKTSRYSLPNLLHAAAVDPKRSLLITDPKGVRRASAQD